MVVPYNIAIATYNQVLGQCCVVNVLVRSIDHRTCQLRTRTTTTSDRNPHLRITHYLLSLCDIVQYITTTYSVSILIIHASLELELSSLITIYKLFIQD